MVWLLPSSNGNCRRFSCGHTRSGEWLALAAVAQQAGAHTGCFRASASRFNEDRGLLLRLQRQPVPVAAVVRAAGGTVEDLAGGGHCAFPGGHAPVADGVPAAGGLP